MIILDIPEDILSLLNVLDGHSRPFLSILNHF